MEKEITNIKTIISREALNELPDFLKNNLNISHPTLICDENTFKAGREVLTRLERERISLKVCMLKCKEICKADETSVGSLLLDIDIKADCLIALGTGTITDLTRILAYKLSLPFVSIPTGTSADAFASSVSPVFINNIKKTLQAKMPEAIFADTTILKNAPKRVNAAGFGDFLSKGIPKTDWYISNIVNNESINNKSLKIIQQPLNRCIKKINELGAFHEETIKTLMDGLIVSGFSIALAGSSRPASGSEHQISHFIEYNINLGKTSFFFHGETVALGAYIMTSIYNNLFSLSYNDFHNLLVSKNKKKEIKESREEIFSRVFDADSKGIIDNWKKNRSNRKRMEKLVKLLSVNWKYLQKTVKNNIFDIDQFRDLMNKSGVPFDPIKMGFSPTEISDMIICAKEMNNKYTLLNLLDELNLLDYFAIQLTRNLLTFSEPQ